MEARGIHPDFVPESSISESVATGLLERDARRVLIVRALEGREALEQILVAGGAQATIAPCYRNVPDLSEAQNIRDKISKNEINWITFTSSSTVTNFIEAIGAEVLANERDSFRVACIGPITEMTARENGLVSDAVADTASVEATAAVLVAFAAS